MWENISQPVVQFGMVPSHFSQSLGKYCTSDFMMFPLPALAFLPWILCVSPCWFPQGKLPQCYPQTKLWPRGKGMWTRGCDDRDLPSGVDNAEHLSKRPISHDLTCSLCSWRYAPALSCVHNEIKRVTMCKCQTFTRLNQQCTKAFVLNANTICANVCPNVNLLYEMLMLF